MPGAIELARQLLAEGNVQMVIGPATRTGGGTRPVFVRQPDRLDVLIDPPPAGLNLAVYLHKKEVRAAGRIALIAGLSTVRGILQLAAENQLTGGECVVILPGGPDQALVLENFAAMEEALRSNAAELSVPDRQELARLAAFSREERWQYWQEAFSRCLKCYACRAACPLCYCERCLVDANQPQWLPVAPHPLGNFEWHINRAMHLAGRCVTCGACAGACPAGIPLHLLGAALQDVTGESFGSQPGQTSDGSYPLSVFRPDDREDFIG